MMEATVKLWLLSFNFLCIKNKKIKNIKKFFFCIEVYVKIKIRRPYENICY